MTNTVEISNKIKYQELEELSKKYKNITYFIQANDTQIFEKFYTKEEYFEFLSLHKNDKDLKFDKIIHIGPFKWTLVDIWKFRNDINWHDFTKVLINNKFKLKEEYDRYTFIAYFRDYLDWKLIKSNKKCLLDEEKFHFKDYLDGNK